MNRRLLSTIRYMRPRDICWRIRSLLKYRLYHHLPVGLLKRWHTPNVAFQTPNSELKIPHSAFPTLHSALEARFAFLNQSHTFENGIEWNTPHLPKLWLYNLHYFDYLHDLLTCDERGQKKAEQLMGGRCPASFHRPPDSRTTGAETPIDARFCLVTSAS